MIQTSPIFNIFKIFVAPTARGRKNSKNTSPEHSPEPPGDPEIDQLFASGGARGPTNNLFCPPGPPPGAIWSAPGTHFGPTWRPEAPRRPPGPDFVPSGPLLGAFFAHFDEFSTLVSHSFHVMFLFVFACVLVFALCFLKASTP